MKNAEVDARAGRLAARGDISKTNAVRLALQNELDRGIYPTLAGRGQRRFLPRRAPAFNGDAANKD